MGAVALVVDVGGIDAAGHFAGPVDGGDVGGEVAGPGGVEVGGEVGVAGVDAGVDDADVDPGAGGDLVGAGLGGADHRHVPLERGEGLVGRRGRGGGQPRVGRVGRRA